MMDEDVAVMYEELVAETDDAYLIKFDERDESVWLPKSQTRAYESKNKIFISKWLADKHELVY